MKNQNSKQKISTAGSRNLETEKIAKEFDFSEIEKAQGRELSFFEKRDAIYRFNEFVSLLREGYGDIIGTEVLIARDELTTKKSNQLSNKSIFCLFAVSRRFLNQSLSVVSVFSRPAPRKAHLKDFE